METVMEKILIERTKEDREEKHQKELDKQAWRMFWIATIPVLFMLISFVIYNEVRANALTNVDAQVKIDQEIQDGVINYLYQRNTIKHEALLYLVQQNNKICEKLGIPYDDNIIKILKADAQIKEIIPQTH
jgi:DNA recombination-dependent growth factor C